MPAFVRTERDEELWERAKRRVREEYDLTEEDGDRFWRLVNGIYQRMEGKEGKKSVRSFRRFLVEKSVGSGFRGWLRKSAPPEVWEKAMQITRDLLQRSMSGAEEILLDSRRSAEEWREVTRKKEHEYGSDEVFADPKHRSYPLTRDGKPSRKRVLAAWRYIHMPRNAEKYADHGESVKQRIRSFARRHFPDIKLEDESKSIGGNSPFPAQHID